MPTEQTNAGYQHIVEAMRNPDEKAIGVLDAIRTGRDTLVESYAVLLSQDTSLSDAKAADATKGLLSMIPGYHQIIGSTCDEKILAERRALVERTLAPNQIADHLPIVTGLLEEMVNRIVLVFELDQRS